MAATNIGSNGRGKSLKEKKIKITIKETKKDSAHCGGGCNGCSCSHCKGG